VASGTPDDLRAQTGQQNLEDAFVALTGLEAIEPPALSDTAHPLSGWSEESKRS
jgi:hypothetical protein